MNAFDHEKKCKCDYCKMVAAIAAPRRGAGDGSLHSLVGCLTTPRDYGVFVANAILTAGGKASTAFTCAALFAEDLERRQAANGD